jgi:hypothetical protein
MLTTTTKKVTSKKVVTTKKPVAKKVVAKTAVKKVTKTSPVSKGKSLVYASNQKSFWVANGQILNSLLALSDALSTMDKKTYAHHVSKDRHDFADWVESVLCEAGCAAAMRQAKTASSAKTVLVKHLKSYKI